MKDSNFIREVCLIASIVLPFFNIPLMIRMIQRKSSEDVSLIWALGIFICLLLIEPAAWVSKDEIFKIYSTMNLVLFSCVTLLTIWLRVKNNDLSP